MGYISKIVRVALGLALKPTTPVVRIMCCDVRTSFVERTNYTQSARRTTTKHTGGNAYSLTVRIHAADYKTPAKACTRL